jgi:hypothetical protein
MQGFGIEKGHLASLRQKFESSETIRKIPPPKPPKPKHLSRPNSMIMQNRISFYEENRSLELPVMSTKSKSDSAVNQQRSPTTTTENILLPIMEPFVVKEQSIDTPRVISVGSSEEVQKRRMIVQEIIDTEKSYLQDLIVLKEIYVVPAFNILCSGDVKLLFGNLDKVIQVSTELAIMLEKYPDYIGDCFVQKVQLL